MKRRQKSALLRKSLDGLIPPTCYSPSKKRYATLSSARLAARAIGCREYQCGDHYHLTSRETFKAPKPYRKDT